MFRSRYFSFYSFVILINNILNHFFFQVLASLTSTFDKKLRSLLSRSENSTINVVPSSVTSTTPSTSNTSKTNKNKVSTTITSTTSTPVVSTASFRDPSLHRRTSNLIEKTSSSTNGSSNLSKSAISSREVEDKEVKLIKGIKSNY